MSVSPQTPLPLRTAIIGLGRTTSPLRPGFWAIVAHLPYLQSSPFYTLTGLLNSSYSSTISSLNFHSLSSPTTAYDSLSSLAASDETDMILISVRVEHHYSLAKPLLEAGKMVFMEWPLAATLQQAEELASLAKENNVRTIVGLQARASPLVTKLRSLLDCKKIGTIVSSTVTSNFGGLPGGNKTWPEGAEYYLSLESGASKYQVYFGHFLDTFTFLLGDFASLSSVLRTDVHELDIVNAEGEIIEKGREKTSPDLITVNGVLESGVGVSITYSETEKPVDHGVGMRWIITGTEGEIEIVVPEGQWQMGPPGTILRTRNGKGEVEFVNFEDGDEGGILKEHGAFPGGNTARLWQAFVEGRREQYADFEDAVKTQRLLEWIRDVAGK